MKLYIKQNKILFLLTILTSVIASLGYVFTVSYTHLDVYKRQDSRSTTQKSYEFLARYL